MKNLDFLLPLVEFYTAQMVVSYCLIKYSLDNLEKFETITLSTYFSIAYYLQLKTTVDEAELNYGAYALKLHDHYIVLVGSKWEDA